MSIRITPAQIVKFHVLLHNLRLDEEAKREIIYNFTNGRSNRTNDMHFNEARDMIDFLAKQAGEQPSPQIAHERRRVSEDKMRKKVIAIAYQLGWTKPNGKIDMDRLNKFIASRPIADYPIKQLNDIKYKDLPKLINQFEQLLTKHLNQFKRK